jgi:hypothetical protein
MSQSAINCVDDQKMKRQCHVDAKAVTDHINAMPEGTELEKTEKINVSKLYKKRTMVRKFFTTRVAAV